MGGKVLVPTGEFVQKLQAARLAADVCDVPTVIIARTDALGAYLLTSDVDARDKPFCTGERTCEGFYKIRGGLDSAIARGLAYAPYADLVWFETSEPSMDEAKAFAAAMHAKFPGKLLAYNCSPSFNWKKKLSDEQIASFQSTLGALGYKFQFVTLAGFHALNFSMFSLAKDYAKRGMAAYSELQVCVCVYVFVVGVFFAGRRREAFRGACCLSEGGDRTLLFSSHKTPNNNNNNAHTTPPLLPPPSKQNKQPNYKQVQEFAAEKDGYAATTHQRFVGTGYFDELAQRIADGQASTTALHGSTEEEQF